MADRIVITQADLEHAVRANAQLEAAGFATTLTASLEEARSALKRYEPEAIVLTGGLHESAAQQLLALARDRAISTLGLVEPTEPDPKAIARTLGLTGWLRKPADAGEVVATVKRLIERRRLQQRTGIIGESPAIQEVLVKIEQFAPVSSTVLIEGESGTGKELVARGIHYLSPRRDQAFIAATNRSLKEAVTLGTVRDDLYYRLNVLTIYLPPLRERRSDIPLLVRTFIAEFAKAHDRPFRGISADALQILVDADWPGNVRQLRNLIESMVVLAPEGQIQPPDVPREIREGGTRGLPMRITGPGREIAGQELEFIFRSLVELKLQVEELRRRLEERKERVEVIEVGPGTPIATVEAEPVPEGLVVYRTGMTMADVERAAIEGALKETRGNRRRAAEVLGIGERTLYRKIKEYALA